MKLKILGSSSKGNCYILETESEALVLECGIPFLEVKKALDFNISKVEGVLVSHEHGDHAAYINVLMKSCINVYASNGTFRKTGFSVKSRFQNELISGEKKQIGNFTVLPFDIKHDAAEPLGFLIYHPECGLTLFATDTYFLPYTFSGLNNILIECNYRLDLLENNIQAGRIPKALRDRTLESHMSFDTCKEVLLANDLTAVNNIVLIHLSDGNSNAEAFKNDIHKATGKIVWVADKGMTIKFDKTPF